MIKLLTLSFLFLFSCSHSSINGSAVVNIDSQLVIPFDEARKDLSTAISPALYKFSKSGLQLWYLAASHTTDPTSDTFKFISDVLNNQKVNVVIVEGFETRLGQNPMAISRHILEGKRSDFYPNAEPSFVVENAIKKNIPFIGGEPSDIEIYQAIKIRGYTDHDLMGFNFVRRIPQLRRSQEVNSLKSMENHFYSYSKEKVKDFGIQNFKFTFEGFKKWYKAKQGQNLSLDSGGKGETAPIEGPYFTQEISKVISTIRDEHILKTIEEQLNQNKNVFIVYGSSHYRVQHKALKLSLGEPRQIKLSNRR